MAPAAALNLGAAGWVMLPDNGNNILHLNHRAVLFAAKYTNKEMSVQTV